MDSRTLNIVLVGMVVVFIVLILLILCIKLYSACISRLSRKNSAGNNGPSRNAAENTVSHNVNSGSVAEGINPELIAAITAAIVASMGGSGTGFKVRSIKHIGHTTPIWNVAGRNEYILSKL